MTEKNFYGPGIALGVLAFFLGFLDLPVEALIASGIALVLNIRKRSTHRIKLGVIFALFGLFFGIGSFVFLFWMLTNETVSTDYWLYTLLTK